MTRRPSISIIGCGRVGTALGMLAARAHWPVRAVADIDSRAARLAARRIGAGGKAPAVLSPAEATGTSGLVLLTVPDGKIQSLCDDMARRGMFARGALVAHCSGVLDDSVLAAARKCGCATGSLHPLQTFPTAAAAVKAMRGTFFFLQGGKRALPVLKALAQAVGGRPVAIAPRAKALYHAAACVASNYTVSLIDAALTLGEMADIPRRTLLPALEPLVRATVDNIFALGPEKALTGPIARGDTETVRRHIRAIPQNDALQVLYAVLAAWTEGLAKRK